MNVATGTRSLRKERGWSQDALARRAEKPKQTIQNLESGRTKNPDLQTIVAIAGGFEMPVPQFLEECARRDSNPNPAGYQSWAFAA